MRTVYLDQTSFMMRTGIQLQNSADVLCNILQTVAVFFFLLCKAFLIKRGPILFNHTFTEVNKIFSENGSRSCRAADPAN
jgi:hypothetical protein